jgi:serine protease Do
VPDVQKLIRAFAQNVSPRNGAHRSRCVGAVLALLLSAVALGVFAATNAVPKPTPVKAYRRELAGAFNKPTPASIADLRAIEQQVESLVPRVSPAVVAVEVGSGSGSGVIISADGLVLTAGHVCGRPNREVRFTFPDGKIARGKTLGLDEDSDTGLMRITNSGPWPHVVVGDLDQIRVGDWALALGHPGGFDPKRSLVVRLGRIIRLEPDIIQTDCTISPGDSGGPLFDMHGRVIAIHSAISTELSENFHVPITDFYETWPVLAGGQGGDGQSNRLLAYVGATTLDDADGCRFGAIEKNSPAAKAGLKTGDLLLKVDGREIKVSASFRRWVAESRPGETLKLEVKRGTKLLSLDMKLQDPPRGG